MILMRGKIHWTGGGLCAKLQAQDKSVLSLSEGVLPAILTIRRDSNERYQHQNLEYLRLCPPVPGRWGQGGEHSVTGQKDLIRDFLSRHPELRECGMKVDDGYTGSNFDRPAFQAMMDEVKAGKINCIVVKDLSRFGRDHLEAGEYIERIFPFLGVRFIAINDHYDSEHRNVESDELIIPFKNLINEAYCRDTSIKIRSQLEVKRRRGDFIGSFAVFGYLKDPEDKHRLVVDDYAADVVRDIFQMFADGIGYVRMTKILRQRGILNPQAYFNQNNPDYYKNSDYWRKPFDWHATSIRAILNNPVYLGKVVFGRSKTKGFFDKRRVETGEEEWVVAENTHEPLISQELWDTVHQMMKARRRENGKGEVQPFAGLVKCADCGSSLNVSYDKKKGRYTGFSCWVYKNYGKERCTSHAIGWKTLNQLVLEDIRRNAMEARVCTGDYMDMLISSRTEKKKEETDRWKRELKKVDKRMAELSKILNKLYEDLALEKISEERYQAMAPDYEREQILLREKREKLTAEIAKSEEIYENVEKFLPVIWKYTNLTELNAHVLNELIEKIVVHEKVVAADGSKSQQVDIYYKFIGCINRKRSPASYAAPEKAALQEHLSSCSQTA